MSQSLVEQTDVGTIALDGGISLTPSGAVIDGQPTIEQFCSSLQKCYQLANVSMWAIGDLLLYGETRGDYGESYSQAIELTQKSYWSLSQAVRVSKAYPQDDRPYANKLSWSHHQEAAKIKDIDIRNDLLERAVNEGLSRDDLRELSPKPELAESNETKPTGMSVVCPSCGHTFEA
jgi:hypothetical protein